MGNNSISRNVKNKIGLYRNNKLVKIFDSQMKCSKFFKVGNYVISDYLNNKLVEITFLKGNEKLKKISDTTFIKFEINLFKSHLKYLKTNDKLHFFCNNCLNKKQEILPIENYQTVGVCENCIKIKEVSCSYLNKWLFKNQYNLKISDRSRFLIELMPFYLVKKELDSTINNQDFQFKEETKEEKKAYCFQLKNEKEEIKMQFRKQKKIQSESFEEEKQKSATPFLKRKEDEKKDFQKQKEELEENLKKEKETFKFQKKQKFKKQDIIDFFIIGGIVLLFIIGLFFVINSGMKAKKEKEVLHTVKAIILDKNSLTETIIYKNTDGNIFKINKALRFWDCGEKGDSISIKFKNLNRPIFIEVKPINK